MEHVTLAELRATSDAGKVAGCLFIHWRIGYGITFHFGHPQKQKTRQAGAGRVGRIEFA